MTRVFEIDASNRAFKYFNENVEGFYHTEFEWIAKGHNDDYFGWNFNRNPLSPNIGEYFDYYDQGSMRKADGNISSFYKFFHF